MRNLSKIFFILGLVSFGGSGYSAAAVEADQLYRSTVLGAITHPDVASATREDCEFKTAGCTYLSAVLEFIHDRGAGINPGDLLSSVRARLQAEALLLGDLREALTHQEGWRGVPWSLKTHKMMEAVADLLRTEDNPTLGSVYLTESNMASLLSGKHLFDDISVVTDATWPVVLGQGFWGTTRGPRYTVMLYAVAADVLSVTTDRRPKNISDVMTAMHHHVDEVPLVHMVPLPGIPAGFDGSLFFALHYMEGDPRAAFNFTHTGFSFGGHRNDDDGRTMLEPRYPKGKVFGPQDCSSYVARVLGYPHVTATLYQWMLWLMQKSPAEYAARLAAIRTAKAEDADDIESRVAEHAAHFVAVPPAEQREGDLVGYRVLKDGVPLGSGGHAGLFVGRAPDGAPLFFGANRGLPQTQVDGIGIERKLTPEGAQPFVLRRITAS